MTNEQKVTCDWQDGRSTDVTKVKITFDQGVITLEFPDGHSVHHILKKAKIAERMKGLPLRVNFGDGTLISVPDGPLARQIGKGKASWIASIEGNLLFFFLPLVAGTLLALYLIITFIVPPISDTIAQRLPVSVANKFGMQVMGAIGDGYLMEAPESQYAQMFEEVIDLSRPGFEREPATEDFQFELLVSNNLGRNAFAVPNGKIVFGQETIDVLDDEQIYAVMAHELSHVLRRHSLSAVVRVGTWYVLGALILGDYSFFLLSAVLLEAGYSRDDERQADCDAAIVMERAGKDPYLLHHALVTLTEEPAVQSESTEEKLKELEELKKKRQEESAEQGVEPTHKQEEIDEDDGDSSLLVKIFSSHPSNEDREENIRECLARNANG